jgi:hypothetical protein
MLSKSRSFLFAATLIATPLAIAMAQQNNPAGNFGSNRSATAPPGTADSAAASTMNTGDNGARRTTTDPYDGTATNRTTPGATGRTVVPGSNSSQDSSAPSTVQERTGATTSGGGSR